MRRCRKLSENCLTGKYNYLVILSQIDINERFTDTDGLITSCAVTYLHNSYHRYSSDTAKGTVRLTADVKVSTTRINVGKMTWGSVGRQADLGELWVHDFLYDTILTMQYEAG